MATHRRYQSIEAHYKGTPYRHSYSRYSLLRWISIGSNGYKPMHHSDQPASIYITYHDHGYADDNSSTTSTLENLPIKIKKLRLFSKYTGLELETTNCEGAGALWGFGNLMSKENTSLLRSQIKTIKFEDG